MQKRVVIKKDVRQAKKRMFFFEEINCDVL